MQLQELKKELKKRQCELKLQRSLLAQREVQMTEIVKLKESISSKLTYMQYLKGLSSTKVAILKQQVDQESELIVQLKLQLQKIDCEIDRIEDENEERVLSMKESLIAQIKSCYPAAAELYHAYETHLLEARLSYTKLIQMEQSLLPLQEILHKSTQIPSQAKFFDYLIGRHPKALLARMIHKATQNAETILKNVDDFRIKSFLEKLLSETKRSWNRPLYQGGLTIFANELASLMSDLQEEIAALRLIITTKEQAIEAWIAQYTM